ncbi:hypothetical protein CYPRO_2345 [Cyclonatronum proteinivorum]|uniref:Uncharacterized protein n=1 Tax=Cyclonatronum proteinivorum TaxID=1457365 RepID=A0A345UM85_9BACT|nr:hypothetical protein [Cyclonatronum proteinivorum]AXJ01587.1 hypothetical protein CYPRO_2345 [Cyclonatronum proteinivorum]
MDTVLTSQSDVKSTPDFRKLLRRQNQLFWLGIGSACFSAAHVVFILVSGASTGMTVLLSLLIVLFAAALLWFFFNNKIALLATAEKNVLKIHHTPFRVTEIPVRDISSHQWKANQLSIETAEGTHQLHIGWMGYKDNKQFRAWFDELVGRG